MASYETIAEAQVYFDGRLNTDAWDDASTTDRTKALSQSTRIIDRLNYAGKKNSSTQENKFPRYDDTTVPQDIKDACSEIALALLDGVDPEMEFENLNMNSLVYADIKSNFNRGDGVPLHIVAGVPSSVAWRYLFPYLRDPYAVGLSRTS